MHLEYLHWRFTVALDIWSMTRPSTDFIEELNIQSDDDWIVDFPYDIQAREHAAHKMGAGLTYAKWSMLANDGKSS